MQNVDQYNNLSYSFQLPSEVRSQIASYIPGASYPPSIAVDAYPVDSQGTIPRVFPSQLPTPPPSPPSFSRDEPFAYVNASRNQPCYGGHNNTSSWSNYLDPGHRLQFQKVLGSGAYGVVHLAKDISTGVSYAVKALNKYMPNGLPLDRRQQIFQQTEMRLHYQVSQHPNIVSLLRIMDTSEHTYVIMEYCPEGDLFSNITERGRYVGDDVAAKDVFLQILDAVSHCHRMGVYHRDLKPENILVAQGGRQVKLADFGLATTEPYATEFGCGSTFYMSPECQDQSSGKPYYACAPNDIWSLGVILVNLTCGRNPWKSASPKDSTFRAYLEDRHFLKSILPLSDELNDLLGMIFEVDPCKRIKLPELRQRIINCQRFTQQPELPTPIYVNPVPYQEPLSPTSTISDEGSMISDNSDDSTVPSEADPTSEEDYSAFEVMEEDHDFNLDPAFQGPVPEALPAPKVTPKVWDVEAVVPVESFQDSLKSYVPPRPTNPFYYGNARIPAKANQVPFVFSASVKPFGSRPPAQHPTRPTYETRSGPIIINHVVAPTSQSRGYGPHGSTGYASKAYWAKRSYPRDRPTLRGLHQLQLREFMGHVPHRIY